MTTHTTTAPIGLQPTANRPSRWDRAAITTLGTAGCALSYDALQQVATAIHIRGLLTYLFPFVIDGFIAYGVRALLVLRAAPFSARLYIWTLFGTATTASVWANALHAIRLNQQAPPGGLHLGDTTVGVLSTLAPLALAGAVHLHILIARHIPQEPPDNHWQPNPQPTPRTPGTFPGPSADDGQGKHRNEDRGGHGGTSHPRRVGRPTTADLNEMVDLARPLFTADEKPTRETVRQTIRAAGHRISQNRLTQVMNALRNPSTPDRPVPHSPTDRKSSQVNGVTAEE
ncbi:DUF2637 domain-containing protein [Streptomyces rapamycinicus]|uniref:DUF2637 domain-containing protein n=2 Tax=Streptomyces rapamycinicus TaxID=1226757 RepID=A0A0A0NGH1_STRRN|nr:DUF2637 domain-containing protein [Streptomyces rapamycinicus]AGP56321.1 hypothetical protein M271_24130 [Streptomyces rapamycinicus NRRL 5491]MBB4783916.1 hypothetical protein [Streptomyces rapamycinicus]RLV80595.1 hypothetical protein D3C57_119460 [Streptomyces rapamycinicus NRRL 5491]UTO64278.1 DUF2637 domain-containing protein [Streptomyces rapamycinicus]UTP32233.1 DUF2637 domain-containing protein [Streptomyces rapamycinicus NRRL 5491]